MNNNPLPVNTHNIYNINNNPFPVSTRVDLLINPLNLIYK